MILFDGFQALLGYTKLTQMPQHEGPNDYDIEIVSGHLLQSFTCCSGILSFRTSFKVPPVDRDRAKPERQCSRFKLSDLKSAVAPDTRDLHLIVSKLHAIFLR